MGLASFAAALAFSFFISSEDFVTVAGAGVKNSSAFGTSGSTDGLVGAAGSEASDFSLSSVTENSNADASIYSSILLFLLSFSSKTVSWLSDL